mgnify:CR=1 FL=1
MKYYKILKYWWWYNITVNKDEYHKLMDYKTYYHRGWWLLDSKWMANKLQCRFRMCKKIFK